MHGVDAQRMRHRLGATGVVARKHDGLDAQRLQPLDGRVRSGLDGVAKGQQAQYLRRSALPANQPREAVALVLQGVGAGLQRTGLCTAFLQQPAASQQQGAAFHHALHAASRQSLGVLHIRHGHLLRPRLLHDGVRQRVVAVLLQGGRQTQHIGGQYARGGLVRHQRGLAFGEGSGLVERYGCDGMRHLQRLGVLDQNAVARGHARARHDGRGRGQPQRTGAGNDQHRHRMDQRLLDARPVKQPAGQRDRCHHQNRRYKHRADRIDRALDRRLGRLRRFDHADDARQRGFGAHGGGAHTQHAFTVDRSAGNAITHATRHRQAFAGDERFVHVALPVFDQSIDRHALAGADPHDVPHGQLLHGRLHLLIAHQHTGCGRSQGVKRADGVGCLPLGACLQPLAQQHQRDDCGRSFEIQMRFVHHRPVTLLRRQRISQQQIERQAVCRGGAQRHQQIHIAAARLDGPPGRTVKPRAEPELHRRGQQQLPPAAGHPLDAPRQQQHGQHQRRRKHPGCGHRPPGRRAFFRISRLHRLHCLGRVARLLDGSGQRGKRNAIHRLHRGFFGGQVHTGLQHAGNLQQGLFHPAHARRATHALYQQFGHTRSDAVSRTLYGF